MTSRNCHHCGASIAHRAPQAKFCDVNCSRAWHYHNRGGNERQRARAFQKKYGMTYGQAKLRLDDQGGGCAICGTPLSYDAHYPTPHIDHCHATGVVRGLLCSPCNQGLGYFKDDPDRLRDAAEYLSDE